MTKQKGINVLSLFDGIGTGLLALNKSKFKVYNYYASERDDNAIKTSSHNLDNIIQLGDVLKLNDEKLSKLPKIDLLIGGSPCQGFSICGKRLNFDDPRSILFFEYVRILNWLKENNNPNIKFMLENVKMKKEWRDIISNHLGVEPIKINSAKYSAQQRWRYYWFNWNFTQKENNKNIVIEDILEHSNIDKDLIIPKKYKFDIKDKPSGSPKTTMRLGGYKKQGQGQRLYSIKGKSVTLTANGGGWGAKTGLYLTPQGIRQPTIKELCRLQTLPDNYFNGLDLSYNQICKLIGNSWTADVIVDIFNNIKM
jgi:DNA (cytosine-5)-methyltransferase 3A